MKNKRLKFLFLVQGEGRGHMTQALALEKMISSHGHRLTCVVVGKSKRRQIPSFFTEKIKAPLFSIESPNFVADAKNKEVRIFSSILWNICRLGKYLASLRKINTLVREHQPDVVVNFYDILGGLYFLLYNPGIKYICVGHQYFLLHSQFQFPANSLLNKYLLNLNTQLTSFRADKLLALSFKSVEEKNNSRLVVVPPLLRKEVFKISSQRRSYYVAYTVNTGYLEEIIEWHKQHRHIELHCFTDSKALTKVQEYHDNLFLHQINDTEFLQYLSQCNGYVSSAGFESICEAMYLGKPVMMVPVGGHFEQECNAMDACKAGAGIKNNSFDLTQFINYLPDYQPICQEFKRWVEQSEDIFINHLCS